jgi:hypothetical protein
MFRHDPILNAAAAPGDRIRAKRTNVKGCNGIAFVDLLGEFVALMLDTVLVCELERR